jgi:hypothetical protein
MRVCFAKMALKRLATDSQNVRRSTAALLTKRERLADHSVTELVLRFVQANASHKSSRRCSHPNLRVIPCVPQAGIQRAFVDVRR